MILSQVSLSARRAWIEILIFSRQVCVTCVALRKESVDRNSVPFRPASHLSKVALRKESVDRNDVSANNHIRVRKVALRKESVDRNRQNYECFNWIKVALRKESVDRNTS